MSKFQTDMLEQYGYQIDETIYNIIDTNVFRKLPKNVFNKTDLEKLNPKIKNKKILLFVGRPSWRKNIEFLLGIFTELCRRRDDVLLYLHVDFDDQGIPERPNMRKLIHGYSLKDKIIYTEENKWTTGVNSEFLNGLYNLCDLYISPHGGEGFGLPFCEAGSVGVPFVATNCTTMPEFAGENEERGLLVSVDEQKRERGILRPWANIKEFVDKIEILLENESLRKKMGRNFRKWVIENCSKSVIIPKWKKVFDKLDVPFCTLERGTTVLEWSDEYKLEAKQ